MSTGAPDPLGGLGPAPGPAGGEGGEAPEGGAGGDGAGRGPPDLVLSQRHPPAPSTVALCAVLGLAFVAQAAVGNWDTQSALAAFRLGALNVVALEQGDFWRLGAYAFLHFGLAHLLINLWSLWILMRPAEALFGPVGAVGLFAAASLAGGALSALSAHRLHHLVLLTAGASGGIFGLLGAQIAQFLRLRHRIPPAQARSALRGLLSGLFLTLLASWAATQGGQPIDHAAHLGGLAVGLLLALVAPTPLTRPRAWSRPAGLFLLGSALALFAVEGAAVAHAVSPRQRRLEGAGFSAEIPWMLVPIAPGVAVAPGGAGLSAEVLISDVPISIPPGSDSKRLGERTWVHTPARGPHGEEATTLVAREGRGQVRVVVVCERRECRGLAGAAADQIARTLRTTG